MEIRELSHYINQSKIIKPKNHEKKIRIAFVGSFSLNGFEETIQVQCDNEKINCTTYNYTSRFLHFNCKSRVWGEI